MNARNHSPDNAGLDARQLVELAALVATHGAAVMRAAPQLSTSGLQQYWSASKCRLDRWGRFLKELSRREPLSPEDCHDGSAEARAWLEEIFVSEALTRVWAAVALAHDRLHGSDLAESVVRSVLLGHGEARHRAMRFLPDERRITAEDANCVDRLRRRVDRWIDLLVAHVQYQVRCCGRTSNVDVCELAIDPVRARDFADDLSHQSGVPGGQHVWSLAIASLRAAFSFGLGEGSPNADLNYALAASVVACFSPELFDSTGAFHSLWILRLINRASDVQGMIDDLLRADDLPDAGQAAGGPHGPRR
jgi:hypothetical protein